MRRITTKTGKAVVATILVLCFSLLPAPLEAAAQAEKSPVTGKTIVDTAKKYQGKPYVFGGATPKGFDCSGFVMYVYGQHKIKLPRQADAQYKVGQKIDKKKLQPGDLVFFSTYEPGPSHVGIYVGNNKFIHASSGAHKVIITPLDNSYFKARYLGARRVLPGSKGK